MMRIFGKNSQMDSCLRRNDKARAQDDKGEREVIGRKRSFGIMLTAMLFLSTPLALCSESPNGTFSVDVSFKVAEKPGIPDNQENSLSNLRSYLKENVTQKLSNEDTSKRYRTELNIRLVKILKTFSTPLALLSLTYTEFQKNRDKIYHLATCTDTEIKIPFRKPKKDSILHLLPPDIEDVLISLGVPTEAFSKLKSDHAVFSKLTEFTFTHPEQLDETQKVPFTQFSDTIKKGWRAPDFVEPSDLLSVDKYERAQASQKVLKTTVETLTQLSKRLQSTHPLSEFFNTYFPYPKSLIFKIGKNDKGLLTIHSIQIEFRTTHLVRYFDSKPKDWNIHTQLTSQVASEPKHFYKLSKMPTYAWLEQKKSMDASNPIALALGLKGDALKSSQEQYQFRFPGSLKASEFTTLWWVNAYALLYESFFMTAHETQLSREWTFKEKGPLKKTLLTLDETNPTSKKEFLGLPSVFFKTLNLILSKLQETPDPKDPNKKIKTKSQLQSHIESWLTPHWMLTNTPLSNHVIEKSLDSEGEKAGKLIRAYTQLGLKRGDAMGPALLLDTPTAEIALGGKPAHHKLMGWSSLAHWTRMGLMNILIKHIVTTEANPVKSLEFFSKPDGDWTKSVAPHIWTPKVLTSFTQWLKHDDIHLNAQRYSTILTSDAWQHLHTKLQTQMDSASKISKPIHDWICPLMFENPFCDTYKKDVKKALYYDLGQTHQTLIAHITPAFSQTYVTFEQLGTLHSNPTPVGTRSAVAYPAKLEKESKSTFLAFQKRLFKANANKEDVGSLIDTLKPETLYTLGSVSRVFQNYADSLYKVQAHLMNSRVRIVIEKKASLDDPITFDLPNSCTVVYQGNEKIPILQLPSTVFAQPISDGIGNSELLIAIGCGSGEIIFTLGHKPLSCGDEDRTWHGHTALFSHNAFETYPNTFSRYIVANAQKNGKTKLFSESIPTTRSPKHFQSYLRNLLCHNKKEWAYSNKSFRRKYPSDSENKPHLMVESPTFHEVVKNTMTQFRTYGVPMVNFFKLSQSTKDGFTLFVALRNGSIYPVSFSKFIDMENKPFWQLSVTPPAAVFSKSADVHYRNDINPYTQDLDSKAQLRTFPLGRPIDIVLSQPFSSKDLVLLDGELSTWIDASNQFKSPTHLSKHMGVLLNDPQCANHTFIMAFALLSKGAPFSKKSYSLAKWVVSKGAYTESTNQVITDLCTYTVQNLLGHGQIVPLQVNGAQKLTKLNLPSPHTGIHRFIPYLAVDGSLDGSLTFFEPKHLIPIPQTTHTSVNDWWGNWAKGLSSFLPSHYFYFRSNTQTSWLTKNEAHTTCVGLSAKDHALTKLSTPDHHGCSGPDKTLSWFPITHHSYTSPNDNLVLLQKNPKHMRDLISSINMTKKTNISASNSNKLAEFHLPFSVIKNKSEETKKTDDQKKTSETKPNAIVSLFKTLSNQQWLRENYAPLFNPTDGQEHLMHFLSTTPISFNKHTESHSGELDALKKQLLTFLEKPESEETLEEEIKTNITKRLQQYFCSFLTLSYTVDHLKVIPGVYDLTTYPQFTDVYRDPLKILIQPDTFECDAIEENQEDINGDINTYTSSSPMLELKISALNHWVDGYPSSKNIHVKNQLQDWLNIRENFSKSETQKLTLEMIKQLQHPLLIKKWLPLLSTISSDFSNYTKHLEDIDSFEELFEKEIAFPIKPVDRFKEIINSEALWSTIKNWTSHEDDSQRWMQRFLSFYFLDLLSRVSMYVDSFGPAVRKTIKKLFPALSLEKAHNTLMKTAQFKSIDTDHLNSVKKELKRQFILSYPKNADQEKLYTSAWANLHMCSVDMSDYTLSCGIKKEEVSLSENGKQFLNQFLLKNLQIKARLALKKKSHIENALQFYIKNHIRHVYMVGVRNPDHPFQIIPGFFAAIHTRPSLSTMTESGQFYKRDGSYEYYNLTGTTFPSYEFKKSYLHTKVKKKYHPNPKMAAWPLTLIDKTNAWDFTSEKKLTPQEFQDPKGDLNNIAIGVVATPSKTSEILSVYPNSKCDILFIAETGKKLIKYKKKSKTFKRIFKTLEDKGCRIHKGAAPKSDTYTIAFGKTLTPLQDQKIIWKVDHLLLLNRALRSVVDIQFQSFWDQWVHYPISTDTNVSLPKLSIFKNTHMDLFTLIQRNKKLSDHKYTKTPYSIDHIDHIITKLIKPLYESSKEKLSSIKGYDDTLAREIMFPNRYVAFPKFSEEFKSLKIAQMACVSHAGQSQSLNPMDITSKSCLEARTKLFLRAVASSFHGLSPTLLTIYKSLWKAPFVEQKQVDPFLAIKSNSETGLSVLTPNSDYFSFPSRLAKIKTRFNDYITSHLNLFQSDGHSSWWMKKSTNQFVVPSATSALSWFKQSLFLPIPKMNSTKTLTLNSTQERNAFFTLSLGQTEPQVENPFEEEEDLDLATFSKAIYQLPKLGKHRHGLESHSQPFARNRFPSKSGMWLIHEHASQGFQASISQAEVLSQILLTGVDRGDGLLAVAPISIFESSWKSDTPTDLSFETCMGVTCHGFKIKQAKKTGTLNYAGISTSHNQKQSILTEIVLPFISKNLSKKALVHLQNWKRLEGSGENKPEILITVNITTQLVSHDINSIEGYKIYILSLTKSGNTWVPKLIKKIDSARAIGSTDLIEKNKKKMICLSYLAFLAKSVSWVLKRSCSNTSGEAQVDQTETLANWIRGEAK